MDGGLHPFIAFTYFSAHPLNDTHSYTLTLHPSFFPSSSNSYSFLLSFPLILSSSHYWISLSSNLTSIPPPSWALFSHFLGFVSLPLTVFHAVSLSLHPSFIVWFHIQYGYPTPCALYTSWMTKEDKIWQKNDRGVIVSKGWVGLQYTRLPHEEATWAFFCSLPRERVCVYVSASL